MIEKESLTIDNKNHIYKELIASVSLFVLCTIAAYFVVFESTEDTVIRIYRGSLFGGLLGLLLWLVIIKQILDLIQGQQYVIRGKIDKKWTRQDKNDKLYQKIDIISSKSGEKITRELRDKYYHQANVGDEITIIYLPNYDEILSYEVTKSNNFVSQKAHNQSNILLFAEKELLSKTDYKIAMKRLYLNLFSVSLFLFLTLYPLFTLSSFNFESEQEYLTIGAILLFALLTIIPGIKAYKLIRDLLEGNKYFFIGKLANKETVSNHQKETYRITVYSDVFSKETVFNEVPQNDFDKISLEEKIKIAYLKRSNFVIYIEIV